MCEGVGDKKNMKMWKTQKILFLGKRRHNFFSRVFFVREDFFLVFLITRLFSQEIILVYGILHPLGGGILGGLKWILRLCWGFFGKFEALFWLFHSKMSKLFKSTKSPPQDSKISSKHPQPHLHPSNFEVMYKKHVNFCVL
jgi:hypothetical protein